MNEAIQSDKPIINKRIKKHSHFLKIYIKTNHIKLSFIPIPYFFINFIILSGQGLYKIFGKKVNDSNMSKKEILEAMREIRKIIRKLRGFSPFEIVNVEAKDTIIIIKTI